MQFEPGPYFTREEMPLGPRVASDGLFERRAEMIVGSLADTDAPLASLQGEIATNSADGLDGRFSSTIGVAEAVTASQGGAGDDQQADTLVEAGGGSEAYRASVQRYLPQPSAPIEGNFLDLPIPPGGHPGGGGRGDDNPDRD